MMRLNQIMLVLGTLLLICSISFGQLPEIKSGSYIIYSTKLEKIVDVSEIIKDMDNYDVLFYGEEHDDIITHQLQNLIYQMMYEKYKEKTTLSMEMFERDCQYILNEYLNDDIKEKYLIKDGRAWGNYTDYRPMIEFAKVNKLKVVAANAPGRYVNIASRNGIEALIDLSPEAKKAIAPVPYNIASGDYLKKLRALSGDTLPNRDTSTMDTSGAVKYDFTRGHSLWDATMAYSIYECKKATPSVKMFHLNGRFHTDERYGIVLRLAEYDNSIKTLVISSDAGEKNLNKIDFSKYKKNGDYLVFTKPNTNVFGKKKKK